MLSVSSVQLTVCIVPLLLLQHSYIVLTVQQFTHKVTNQVLIIFMITSRNYVHVINFLSKIFLY